MADAFYVPLEADPSRTGEETGERFRSTGHTVERFRSTGHTVERFRSTGHTAGPWHARDQHAGPPAALLARAVERCAPRPDTLVARVSVDLLGPVPVAEVSVGARVLRPGRAVELVEAELSGPDGRVVARMTAWRIATAPSGVEPAAGEPAPLPVPAPQPFSLEPGWLPGYLQAVDWRWAEGHFLAPGPATVWTRLRHPLVAGEEPTGLQRLLAVADSGSGVSGVLDLREWLFVNPELTVHVARRVEGEWVCMRARTQLTPGGVGLATSVLYDERGEVGRGAQALLVRPR